MTSAVIDNTSAGAAAKASAVLARAKATIPGVTRTSSNPPRAASEMPRTAAKTSSARCALEEKCCSRISSATTCSSAPATTAVA